MASLASLLQRSTIEDHGQVLNSSNAVLTKSKSDIHAQHVKAVALLKLDRFEDSLRFFEESGDHLKQRASLEYAYALYKCGRLEEALHIVASVGVGRGARHLEAQAGYRAEKFRRTAEIYEALSKEKAETGNEENDLRINSWATDAQLQWKGQAEFVRHERPVREDLEAFETAYNAACLSIAKGELGQGEILLKRAKELCRTSDDLAPEDKAAELLPIAVQQLYVLVRQGRKDEAESLVKEISPNDVPEPSTKKIAKNNAILASQKTANPYLLYKALHETPTSTDSDKLFDFQNNVFVGNTHSIDLLVRKYGGIIRSTSKALSHSAYPSTDPNTNLLSVYNAAAHAQTQTGTAGLKEILPLLERRPKDLGLLLTVVQIYVGMGKTTAAINALEKTLQALEQSISEEDKDVRFNPGLLSVLVSLYKLEGRKVQIRSELGKAASHWRERADTSLPLLRAAAVSLLDSSDQTDLGTAGELFQTLYQNNPDDRFAVAGYVASQATVDYAKIESQVNNLPSSHDLVGDVDAVALEKSGVPTSSSTAAAAAATIAHARKRVSGEKEGGRATKRIRKSRLPKDYDPSKTPDPERWLPLRDRSTYRPKGRKGRQKMAERTQGGVVSEKVEESSGVSGGQQPQKSQGGGANSKKKKKGKR